MSIRTSTGLRSVIGVVNDTMLPSRVEPMSLQVYLPMFQNPRYADARYVIRVRGDPGSMLPSIVREVGRVDPDVPVTEVMTRLAQTTLGASNVRLAGGVAAYGAILAIVLTAVGLYGVLAFSVQRRTKELGIRKALGASPRSVRQMVLGRGARLIGMGIAAGLLLAAAAARFMTQMLYSPPAADPLVYSAAAIAVALVGLLASSIPAAKAASLDPTTALRVE
jgi:predicted lysophospholipase L1 biosynthesis ABC-type transport system permease subunit